MEIIVSKKSASELNGDVFARHDLKTIGGGEDLAIAVAFIRKISENREIPKYIYEQLHGESNCKHCEKAKSDIIKVQGSYLEASIVWQTKTDRYTY